MKKMLFRAAEKFVAVVVALVCAIFIGFGNTKIADNVAAGLPLISIENVLPVVCIVFGFAFAGLFIRAIKKPKNREA